MGAIQIRQSDLDPARAVYDFTLPAGEPWMHEIKRGQTLRIVDLEGNQAVDTLFFSARDPAERYSAQDTVRRQGNIYLTTGSALMSSEGKVMLRIVAGTTRSAVPVQPRATPCATHSTRNTCTTAATIS